MTYRDPTRPWYKYIGKTGLIMHGWTESLIRDRLPPPEELGGNLAKPPSGATNRYWKITTVERIERDPVIAAALAKGREILRKRGELTSDSAASERLAHYRKLSKDRHEKINALAGQISGGEEDRELDAEILECIRLLWRFEKVMRPSIKEASTEVQS
ncbi:MAG: hypothetical protein ACREU8_10650 [Gammaproteobacteria bacterium]